MARDIEKEGYSKELDGISAQKELEEKINQMEIIFQAIPGGVAVTEFKPPYYFISVSEELANLCGYTVEEFIEVSGNLTLGAVYEEDREMAMAELTRQVIDEGRKYYTLTYRVKTKDGSLKLFKDCGKIVDVGNGNYNMYSFYVDITAENDKEQLIAKQTRLLEEKERQRRVNRLISALSKDYSVVLLCDIKNDRADTLYVKEDIRVEDIIGTNSVDNKLSEIRDRYVDMMVYEGDKEKFLELTKVDYIKEKLGIDGVYSFNYREAYGESFLYNKFKCVKIEEGETDKVIIGYFDVDKEVRAELEHQRELSRLLCQQDFQLYALRSTALVVYNINVTKDEILSSVIQKRGNKSVDILKMLELDNNCSFSEFISAWKYNVDEEYRERFAEFFDVHRLTESFNSGEMKGTISYKTTDAHGNKIWAKQTILLVEDKETGDILAYTYANDITLEMNRLEEQEKAAKAAKDASDAKSAFLFNMSHDIRTPMNAIIGYTQLAKKHAGEQDLVMNYLSKIESSGEVLLKLINDVLNIARIESGKLDIEMQRTNIKVFEDLVHTLYDESMAKAGIDFIVEKDVQDEYVYCDANHMSQIFINLLSNALKFTPRGGKIIYRLVQKAPAVDGYATYELHVIDNGVGMSREFIERMYDTFERARTATESKVQGTGLGLAIVKKIADTLGANLECKSELGKGTEFIVTYKLEVAQEDEIYSIGDSVFNADVSLKGRRILLVEDNELNQEIAMEILKCEGAIVELAEDGMIALQKVLSSKPGDYDAILMDVQMPIMDGYTATKEIRNIKNPELARIPIIAMTANAFHEDEKMALEMGMDGFISKPFDVERLGQELNRFFK